MRLAGHNFWLSFTLLRDPEIVLSYVCFDIESILRVETFIVNQQIYHLSVPIEYLYFSIYYNANCNDFRFCASFVELTAGRKRRLEMKS